MFLGIYNPDKKSSVQFKLADACARYEARYGIRPELAMMSHPEVKALRAAGHDEEELPIKGASFIPRHTFYVGQEDRPSE